MCWKPSPDQISLASDCATARVSIGSAAAVRVYAKQRKNPDLLLPAIDICKRAETRAGELLAEMARAGERQGDGKRSRGATVSTLADFRGQTEHILFGVRGSLPLKRKDIGTILNWSRGPGGHSSKPPEIYELMRVPRHD